MTYTAQQELESFGYHQELKRSLGLWQLTAFGLNYMIPIAPAIIFGFVLSSSGGTVALPYLLACIGMLFTASSYTILMRKFPISGSLYSYVSRGINPHVGFIAGWVLCLDYLLIPTVTTMSAAIYLHQLIPSVPYELWLLVITFSTGFLNLFGVQLMATLGLWLLLIGEIVIFTGFVVWSYSISAKGVGVGHLFSLEPFHFHSASSLAAATSIAILSYLGFDAITTLSEESKNPKRDIPRAIFISVIIGAITMFLTGYLGMLAIPNWHVFQHNDLWLSTTLFYVAKLTGGEWFTLFYTSGFILAMAVFNIVATAAGARLLYAMGRDQVLPKRVFGAINKRYQTPHWNIILIVIFVFLLGTFFKINSVAELVNYGALLGFSLLNISVIWYFIFKKHTQHSRVKSLITYAIFPLCGTGILLWVFVNMQSITLTIGSIWLIIGLLYGAYRSKGYRKLPPVFNL
jgi:putrescine importer